MTADDARTDAPTDDRTDAPAGGGGGATRTRTRSRRRTAGAADAGAGSGADAGSGAGVPDALPVGVASTGEYAELTFVAPVDPADDLGRLSTTLPEGMDVLTWTDVPAGAPRLASLLPATLWELVWPPVDATALTALLRDRCEDLLAASSAEVVRQRPDGARTLDVRPAVVALAVAARPAPDGAGARTVLRAVLRNDAPIVRPTDLLAALGDGFAPPALVRRVAQGAPTDAGLDEALTGTAEPVAPELVAGAA